MDSNYLWVHRVLKVDFALHHPSPFRGKPLLGPTQSISTSAWFSDWLAVDWLGLNCTDVPSLQTAWSILEMSFFGSSLVDWRLRLNLVIRWAFNQAGAQAWMVIHSGSVVNAYSQLDVADGVGNSVLIEFPIDHSPVIVSSCHRWIAPVMAFDCSPVELSLP